MFIGKIELVNDRSGYCSYETIPRDTKEEVISALFVFLDAILPENIAEQKEVVDALTKLAEMPLAKSVHTLWRYSLGTRRLHLTMYSRA